MAEAAHSQVYRRRRPERSVAYRALTHHFERFLQVYEDRFEPTFGYLRSVVARVVYRYLDYGLLEQGFARLKWAEWAGEELLEDVPHRQVVFTTSSSRLGLRKPSCSSCSEKRFPTHR